VTLKLADKKAIVAEIGAIAKNAHSVVSAEYRKLTVSDMTALRVKARSLGVIVRVVRNTLASRALEDTNFSCLKEKLVGPLLLAFSENEPGAAPRLMRAFAKEHEKLVIKSLAFDGRLLAATDLDKLADLPTREEAISILMSVIKAPITKLARTLSEPHAKLTRTMAALGEQLQSAG
jgi:large subunit ribosomal protein L10